MSDQDSNPSEDSQPHRRARSADSADDRRAKLGQHRDVPASDVEAPMPKMGEAEIGALHIRVIALENLVIALLAGSSDRQLELSRNMARYIAPREGYTHHPLTGHAATHMNHLVERSARFGSGELPRSDDID